MMEECTPRTSGKWKPHHTYGSTLVEQKYDVGDVEDIERKGNVD